MKKTIITILALALLAGLILFINNKPAPDNMISAAKTYSFTTTDNRAGSISYHDDNYDTATLKIDGEEYILHSVVSGSGSRYANDDETIVYWEHQGEATIEINGLTTTAMIDLGNEVRDTDEDCDGRDDDCDLIINDGVDQDCDGVDQDCDRVNENDKVDEIHIDALTMYQWQWKETRDGKGGVTVPRDSKQFIAHFSTDGKFSSTTDCNNLFGSYTSGDGSITLEPIGATKKACVNETQEISYTAMLQNAEGYMINDNGELILTLEPENTTMIFVEASQEKNADNPLYQDRTTEHQSPLYKGN